MNTKTWAAGLLLTVATLTSTSLLAQQTTTPAATNASQEGRMNRGGGMNGGQMADPATRAQRMTDRMTQELGLDEATSKKVYTATIARDQQIDAIQKGTDDDATKEKNMKANADQYKTAMQGILTADQFTKFEQMRQRGGRGNGGGRRENAGGTNPNN